jgi:hypothetical protein
MIAKQESIIAITEETHIKLLILSCSMSIQIRMQWQVVNLAAKENPAAALKLKELQGNKSAEAVVAVDKLSACKSTI